MVELGKMHKLEVTWDKGTVLVSHADIFLPVKNAPLDLKTGDQLEVFVYKDVDGKITATAHKPKLVLGELAVLTVVEIANFGAFLDWGLEKDLLLPVKEQVGKVQKGETVLVGMFLNSSERLCATMRISDLLSSRAPYKENDRAKGIVYRINKDFGAFVAVDNKYQGLIPNKELYGNCAEGDEVQVRIKRVKEDGKLELSLREKAYTEIEGDAQKILDRLKANGGSLRLHDHSSPEQIKVQLQMSKKAFKRAVGRLLKEGAIVITNEGIKLMW